MVIDWLLMDQEFSYRLKPKGNEPRDRTERKLTNNTMITKLQILTTGLDLNLRYYPLVISNLYMNSEPVFSKVS